MPPQDDRRLRRLRAYAQGAIPRSLRVLRSGYRRRDEGIPPCAGEQFSRPASGERSPDRNGFPALILPGGACPSRQEWVSIFMKGWANSCTAANAPKLFCFRSRAVWPPIGLRPPSPAGGRTAGRRGRRPLRRGRRDLSAQCRPVLRAAGRPCKGRCHRRLRR